MVRQDWWQPEWERTDNAGPQRTVDHDTSRSSGSSWTPTDGTGRTATMHVVATIVLLLYVPTRCISGGWCRRYSDGRRLPMPVAGRSGGWGLPRAIPHHVTLVDMARQFRRRFAVRGICLAAALAVVAAGTGLPMCLNLVQQAGQSCPMHGHHTHGAGTQGSPQATVSPAPADQSCHPGQNGPGCAAGAACPTTGAAAPAWGAPPIVPIGPAAVSGWARPAEPYSFLAPPLFPPPQA